MIAYAKAPMGELRFKAPVKTELTDEIINAEKFGNRSAQAVWDTPDGFYKKEFYWTKENKTSISEDGLYLNIWTKEPEKEKKKPVMFYIHGGGFLGGTGQEIEFITDAYATRNVVLVTINYRVESLVSWHIRGCVKKIRLPVETMAF
jgi:para-nitrobenzyl esterase